jgi:hypothetical protein
VAESSDLTALEWLHRLAPRIVDPDRQSALELWRRYYHGDHNLPTGPSQISDAFRMFQRKARTNLCGLAVRSMADRMEIIGYRDGDGQNDPMWDLFKAARLPGRQFSIWRKALSEGRAFAVAGADPRDRSRPRVTIEGADRVAVETDPADPTVRLAAIRIWHDPLAKRWYATVYLPRERWYFQTDREVNDAWSPVTEAEGGGRRSSLMFSGAQWVPREPKMERSTLLIPVIPYYNADEGEEPLPEFAGEGIDIQDRLNLSVLNRLTTERFQAYRQRALVNFVPDEDPATGLPIPPFKPGSDQVWTVAPAAPGDPEPKFVDLPPSDTRGMLDAIESDMRAFAAATTTPVYYLPGGDMINLSADAIAALDAGHNAKVRNVCARFADPTAELWSIMAEIAGIEGGAEPAPEMIAWAPPSAFHPTVVADYVVKMQGAGVPLPLIMEEVGWGPARIEQLRGEVAEQEIREATNREREIAAEAKAKATVAKATAAARPAPAGGRPPTRPAAGARA